MDPEYFNREALRVQALVSKNLRLGDLVRDGYRVVYETTQAIDRVEGEEAGLPYFLQSADITTPFINAESMGCVVQSDWERYPKGRIQPGELLIEVKGKAEKIAVVPDNFPIKTLVSGTCFKLTTKSVSDRYFLAAYLTCRYGQLLKDRLKTNLLVSYLAKDDLYALPVPDTSAEFRSGIQRVFIDCYRLKAEASATYSEAETLLLNALGLTSFSPSVEKVNVKPFSESFSNTGRLDAEHYQPKYDQLDDAFANHHGGTTTVGALADEIANGAEVREYQAEGTPYLRIGDLKFLDVDASSVVRIDPASAKSGLEKIGLKAGDVLLSRSGSLAVSAVVEPAWESALISSHLIRLRIRDSRIDPYFLALFFMTLPGKMQIQKWSNGGVQPEISQPAVKVITVPVLPWPEQQEIRRLILLARALRTQSDNLLQAAKRAVEIAIEQDEAAGRAYLVQKMEVT